MSKQLSLGWFSPEVQDLVCEYGIDLEVWEADDENWEYYTQYTNNFLGFDILEVDSVRFYLEEF